MRVVAHHTVGLGLVFHALHLRLAFFQARGFALGEFAGFHALVDALLLLRLALVYVQGRGISRRR